MIGYSCDVTTMIYDILAAVMLQLLVMLMLQLVVMSQLLLYNDINIHSCDDKDVVIKLASLTVVMS